MHTAKTIERARTQGLPLEAALGYIADDTSELLESLDVSRARRNEALYDALPVPQASVDEARAGTSELIERVRAHLER